MLQWLKMLFSILSERKKKLAVKKTTSKNNNSVLWEGLWKLKLRNGKS